VIVFIFGAQGRIVSVRRGCVRADARRNKNLSGPVRERLVAQDHKGGDRDGHLDDDRADRQEPDFALGLPIHVFPG
jgi:hypothetical protein